MKSPIRYWIPLIAGAVLFLTGVVYEGMISELPRGNPPQALMDYYNRHHRIATMISGVSGVMLLFSSLISVVIWIFRLTDDKRLIIAITHRLSRKLRIGVRR